MSDPLDALRAEYVPVAPDAAFAARLRARLELAVLRPGRATMSTETETTHQTLPSEGDVVYSSLWLPDVARAEAFYGAVLGWRFEQGRRPNARVVAGLSPHMGMWGDVPQGTLFLCHAVDDVPAAVDRIRAGGGQAAEPVEEPFGLLADCTDNQGMRFAVVQAPRAGRQVPAPRAGGLQYLTVAVPDSGLFRRFYGAVFGWTFTGGRSGGDAWNVHGISPMAGMHGGAERAAVLPSFSVPDVPAAVAAVRAAGGTSTDPESRPYGLSATCADDQGVRFYLGEV